MLLFLTRKSMLQQSVYLCQGDNQNPFAYKYMLGAENRKRLDCEKDDTSGDNGCLRNRNPPAGFDGVNKDWFYSCCCCRRCHLCICSTILISGCSSRFREKESSVLFELMWCCEVGKFIYSFVSLLYKFSNLTQSIFHI